MRERAFLVGVKEMGKPGWETLKPSGSVKTTSRLYVFTSRRAALVASSRKLVLVLLMSPRQVAVVTC